MADEQQPKDANNPSGPVHVGKLKIKVDRDLCIGAATCVAIAPKAFTLDNEAKAIILSTADSESDAEILDAARGCPTHAISVQDERGNTIFPK